MKQQQMKMFIFLSVLTVCSTLGLQIWRTLFDNFSVHEIYLSGNHVGAIQSIREIPGLLSFLVIYLLLCIKEQKLAAVSVLLMGIGIAITGMLPTFHGIIFTTLLMSFGFHYFETTNQSLTLQHFDTSTAPLVFGRLRSMAAATNIFAGLAILGISGLLDFKTIYFLFGFLVFSGGCWGLLRKDVSNHSTPQKKKFILKKRYWLYYLLTFLAGARRQIFIAFAVFLLVKKFDFTLSEIAFLFLVNNCINIFLSPLIGKYIVKFGEHKLLSLEYFSLIFIFIAYGIVESKLVVAILYIADHIFFNFAMGIRTFFQKIAMPEDIAPSMAVGFTINHIAAVFLPVIGGMLWILDPQIVFFLGAFLCFFSLISVQLIPGQLKLYQNEE